MSSSDDNPEGLKRPDEASRDRPGSSGAPETPGVPGATTGSRPGSTLRFEMDQPENATERPTSSGFRKPGQTADARGGVTPEQISELTQSLGASQLQGLRVSNFAYEPVSLPVSRVPSPDVDQSHPASGHHTPASGGSPMLSARAHEVHSPPLTPSGTPYLENNKSNSPRADHATHAQRPGVITPQESTKDASPPVSRGNARPASSDESGHRPVSSSAAHDAIPLGNHRRGMFSLAPSGSGSSGGGGKSLPGSRDASPSRNNPASQFYTRPLTPAGEVNDPYAADVRPPQARVVEARFKFPKVYSRQKSSPTGSSLSLNKIKDDKRHSGMFHGHKKDEGAPDEGGHSRHGSMADLKRFFKIGPSNNNKIKRAVSPAVSIRSSRRNDSKGTHIPFNDERALTHKYGKLGKFLGSGAGGSVRLMKRSEDNTVFAVKEFRARHNYESEKDYVKKLTAEYCIGSSLHHGNIIETLDIINEKGKWYEVMEYAPYDLFAIVMSNKMTRAEIGCCFLQILSGVTYLHGIGLAHRDLKLDNVVVSKNGIMKIIDFGSAHVFKYPFENTTVLASGIVGSDPYLAPEVYDDRQYDPTAVDIWSLAIIFCCMTLRRFPWKVPRMTDHSYKMFASEPTPGHDPKRLAPGPGARHSTHAHADDEPEVKKAASPTDDLSDPEAAKAKEGKEAKEAKETDKPDDKAKDKPADKSDKTEDAAPDKAADKDKRETIKGPWRILRLLPRETRHVIGQMLLIDPRERIKMEDLLRDPWVANTVICRQVGPGQVELANTHTHTLEEPIPQPPKPAT